MSGERFFPDEPLARAAAEGFGTPLYLVGEAELRARCRRWLAAARAATPRAEVAFAVKANPTLGLLRIVADEGLNLDVASEGELKAALRAGVPADRCHLHGNAKSEAELRFALDRGVGAVVLDAFEEIEVVRALRPGPEARFWLRLAPGVDPVTHRKIAVGQADTKFGFNIADGAAAEALARARAAGLTIEGLHVHVGSQLLDPEAQRAGAENLARFALESGGDYRILNVGGGLGVRYTDEEPFPVERYAALVTEAVLAPLRGTRLAGVTVGHEPGRSIVAEAGATLYCVVVVKPTPVRTFVAVDGGLADNPRPAMYDARYEVRRAAGGGWTYAADGPGALTFAGEDRTVTVVGRHCETDVLFPDVLLPADVARGDLLAVAATGAYGAAMASRYNLYPRPASVLVRTDGTLAPLQERETYEEMFARERLPEMSA